MATTTSSSSHLDLVVWADGLGGERIWAEEDCRHMSRRLEADLPARGGDRAGAAQDDGSLPGLGAEVWEERSDRSARVCRGALREPEPPCARLDGRELELRLLVDRREDMVAERTRAIRGLHWHLHKLDLPFDPIPRSLNHGKNLDAVASGWSGWTA